MGCCLSVDGEGSKNLKEKKNEVGFSNESRGPPPSAEEETVKEVLSETPKPKPEPVDIGADVKQLEVEKTEKVLLHNKSAVFAKIQEGHRLHRDFLQKQNHRDVDENVKGQEVATNEEDMSEVSEICSLSMSESVSTTTFTDKQDNEDEHHHEVRHLQQKKQRVSRSPAKLPARNREYGVRRDRVVGQSPSRRSEQSPGKRSFNNGSSMRSGQTSKEESGQPTVRRGGSVGDPRRREAGERSGRRSRSPGTTRSGRMQRSPSSRRTNQSPGRMKGDPRESGSSSSSRKVEGKLGINEKTNNCSQNESLENPLVSLECFIFL